MLAKICFMELCFKMDIRGTRILPRLNKLKAHGGQVLPVKQKIHGKL